MGRRTKINVQDSTLFEWLKNGTTVTLTLSWELGTMQGIIRRFDQFSLVLDDGHEEQLVYKQAVATIKPRARCESGRA